LFVTTQYVTEADYCDRVAILNRGQLLALGTPEEVRRQAVGGEIINLRLEEVTAHALRLLRAIPGLRHLQPLSAEQVRLTVNDASEALQQIITAFQQNAIDILNIEPYRPDFEEVFVRLMEQDKPPLTPSDETGPGRLDSLQAKGALSAREPAESTSGNSAEK
jgi:ABC-2 type transport system ATP-binding protein